MDGSGFFGGLSSGIGEQQAANLEAKKQQVAEQRDHEMRTQQQIDATIQQIGEIAKQAAAAGKDPKDVYNNPAVQALVQSAQGLAQSIGQDPTRVGAMAQLVTMQSRSPSYSVVQSTDAAGNKYPTHVFDASTGTIKPLNGATPPQSGVDSTGAPISPAPSGIPGAPPLSPGDTLSPGTISRANPGGMPQAVATPTPAAPAAPSSPTNASFNGRFAAAGDGSVSDAGAPGATNAKPRLPDGMQPGAQAIDYAISNNVTGPEFMKAIPPNARNTVQDIMDYKLDPEKLSKRIPKGQTQSEFTRVMSWVHQASNGDYDTKYYKPMQAAVKEFTSGGVSSPAGQMTAGNTAIQHAGEIADAYQKMQAVPGLLDKIAKSGTSIASYAAAQLKNASVRGTSEGAALASFLDARERYSSEIERFYKGSQGADAAIQRSLGVLDSAYSPPEMFSALATESRLLSGKVNALQDRWKTSQAGPKFGDAVIRNAIPDFPIIQDKSKQSLLKIDGLYKQSQAQLQQSAQPQTTSTGVKWSVQ